MRHLTEEEKSKLIELGVDISGLAMKITHKAEIKSFSYDIMGVINKMEQVKSTLEWVLKNQPNSPTDEEWWPEFLAG